MNCLKFFYQSIRHPREIGTIVPTSDYTAELMAKEIEGQEIVEFGAGTGVITRSILEHLSKNSHLTCFEINEEFCEYLRDRYSKEIEEKRLRIINESAENLEEYVKNPDCIVSAIPLALMEEKEREVFLEKSKKARKYVQIQYNFWSTNTYKKYFNEVKIKLSLRNFPPACIYICS